MTDQDGHLALAVHPLLRMLRGLGLPCGDYVIFGSGPLLAHGLRADLGDLDIVARGAAWTQLTRYATPISAPSGHGQMVRLVFEVTDRWLPGFDTDALIDGAEYHAGLPFVPLAAVHASKRYTDRPKDHIDLALIDSLRVEVPSS